MIFVIYLGDGIGEYNIRWSFGFKGDCYLDNSYNFSDFDIEDGIGIKGS